MELLTSVLKLLGVKCGMGLEGRLDLHPVHVRLIRYVGIVADAEGFACKAVDLGRRHMTEYTCG